MKVKSTEIERDEDESVSRVTIRFVNETISDDEDDDNRFIVRRDGCAEIWATCFHLCEDHHVAEFGSFLAGLRAEVWREFGI